jgi:uncharacterized protein (TIGR01777 family)
MSPDEAALPPAEGLTVAVTGSTGLVGAALIPLLESDGHRVIRLVRHHPPAEGERQWSPMEPDPGLLTGVDAVVHLAGAPIGRRFTARHKRAVLESRETPTRQLSELMVLTPDGPGVLVSASAIGIYGAQRGDEELTESSANGTGFVADVVQAWEEAASPARQAGLRVACIRTGIVQSRHGGTLGKVLPLFRAGVGGRLGSGTQWTSWIDLSDLCRVYRAALIDGAYSGPINAVGPEPVRNTEYTAILGRALKRPALLPVPKVALAAVLGTEGATELALASQRVLPARLSELGFSFAYPTLTQCLRHQLTD